MVNNKDLAKIKSSIFEGKYNGDVLKPVINILSKAYNDRLETKEYIKKNKLQNTTPGRAFATAEENFEKALYFYMKAKKLMDKLR